MLKKLRSIGLFFALAGAIVLMGCSGAGNDPGDAGGGGGNDYTSPHIGTLKYVPAGSFQRDAHSTNISVISAAFRMSRHEITRQQFFDIMGGDPSDPNSSSDSTVTSSSTNITDPVQRVNWYQVIAFCNKLSIAEGMTPVYSVTEDGSEVDWANLTVAEIPYGVINDADWDAAVCDWSADGYRLPTEMERMWAAMGADQDARDAAMQAGINVSGYDKDFAGYDGSNSIDDFVWHGGNSDPDGDQESTTQPVGTKNENELGLHDLSGSVYEWCWDRHVSDYPDGELTDYRGGGAASGVDRVFAGGSWRNEAQYCIVSGRGGPSPGSMDNNYGFRVVRQ